MPFSKDVRGLCMWHDGDVSGRFDNRILNLSSLTGVSMIMYFTNINKCKKLLVRYWKILEISLYVQVKFYKY